MFALSSCVGDRRGGVYEKCWYSEMKGLKKGDNVKEKKKRKVLIYQVAYNKCFFKSYNAIGFIYCFHFPICRLCFR